MCSQLIFAQFWAFEASILKFVFKGRVIGLLTAFLQNNLTCYSVSILDAKHKATKLRWGNIWSRCWNCQSICHNQDHAWRSVHDVNLIPGFTCLITFEEVKEHHFKLFCKMFQDFFPSLKNNYWLCLAFLLPLFHHRSWYGWGWWRASPSS